MALRAICLPALRFPSCFISSHSFSLRGVPFISVVPFFFPFCCFFVFKKLSLYFLFLPWKRSYGQGPSYIRVTAAQTLLALAVAHSFGFSQSHVDICFWTFASYWSIAERELFFFNWLHYIYFSHQMCALLTFLLWCCKFKSTQHCRCSKCQWQIMFKTIFCELYFILFFKKGTTFFLFTYHYSLNVE